jgi:nicotinamidase-related amidase
LPIQEDENAMTALDALFPLPDRALSARRTALIDVDVQNAQVYGLAEKVRVAGLDAIYREYNEEVAKIVPRIRALKDACRRAGIEVIHLRCASYAGDGRDGCPVFRSADVTEQGDRGAAEVLAEVAPEHDEIVITKVSTAAFNGSDLDTVLRHRGIDTLLVTGLVTDGCVEGTVRGAADRGFTVFLITDASASWTRAQHQDAVRILGRWSARVLDTEAALRRIVGLCDGESVHPLNAPELVH